MDYFWAFDPLLKTPTKTMVVRARDGALIPCDENNADWRAFIAWRANAGGGDPKSDIPIVAADEAAIHLAEAMTFN